MSAGHGRNEIVAAKVGVYPGAEIDSLAPAIDRIESSIRAVAPDAKMVIHLEPELARST